ncbi:hypothetical protein BH24ACT26_BH24ACT26_10590 [soil metagenome]
MDFRILGPLEVSEAGRSLPLGGAKQRTLLAILLLHAPETVSIDRLVDLLWGEEPPETAANALQVYVSQLRKTLEPARSPGTPSRLLQRRPPGYVIEIDPDWLDSRRFERLVDEAGEASDDPRGKAAKLRDALALWRGPALADFSYEPFAQAEIYRLEGVRIGALEARIEAELALGHHARLVSELESLVRQFPMREGLRAHLMVALYRSGRQAEALNVYAETRRALEDELGIDPSASLQELERLVLLQDPSLDPPAPTVPERALETAPLRRSPARKTVSVLCCELDGNGDGDGLDLEAAGAANADLRAQARAALDRHGGTVVGTVGHEVLAVFGVPVVHEDDALRAARAAVEIREALSHLRHDSGGLGAGDGAAGFGIATGEVLVDSGGSDMPRGDVLGAATELARVAGPDEILLSRQAHRHLVGAAQTEPAPPQHVPRRKQPIVAFRLLGSVRTPSTSGRRLNAAMVGRRQELIDLSQAYERTVKDRSCYLYTLLGTAGVGKSRLLAEFVRTIGGRARVLSGRCPPYGEGVTFLPASDIVRQATKLDDELTPADAIARIETVLEGRRDAGLVAERLAEVAGFAELKGSLEEISWALRKLLESLAQRRPLVVMFDDVHWAEPTLLDLVEHIADWSRGVPLLLVCSARPDFLELRPSWGGGKANASSLLLEPLSDHECLRLLENLFGGQASDPEIKSRIVTAAEGNPLFVEEMARMLIDDGFLRSEHGGWVATSDLSTVSIPPTIGALIQARLDRLGEGERHVLQRAAIVGKSFGLDAVAALCDPDVAADLKLHVASLMRKELIRPDHGDSSWPDAYRFRHILIRETAYGQVSKQERALLHEELAASLEAEGGKGQEAIVAHHLERAFHYRRELRRADPETQELGRRAADHLAVCAASASTHGDLCGAEKLLERALDLVEVHDRRRPQLLVALSAVLTEVGELRSAEVLVQEVLGASETTMDGRMLARARLQLWDIRSSSENLVGWKDEALRDVREAISVFESATDDVGMASARLLEAAVYGYDYRFADSDAALEQALAHARRAGNEHEEMKIQDEYARSSLWGPVHVDDAIRRYGDFLERFRGNRVVEANCLRGLAMLEAMQGRFTEARRYLARTRELLSDLGLSLSAATSLTPGVVEMLAGDAVAAEKAFRSSYEGLERAGERNIRATAAAYLARALYEQHRFDEAERLTQVSEELSPEDDFATMVEWASTRAKVLARRGRHREADRLSEQVVRLAARTDELASRGNALMDRAEVLRLIGRGDESTPHVREALGLFERKGDVASANRARNVLDRVEVPRVIDLREHEPTRR